MSLNFSRAITFTFGQLPLGKVWTPLSSKLWVKYHCSSKRMASALNNPRRLICHYQRKKEFTKKGCFKENWNRRIKRKDDFLTALTTEIKRARWWIESPGETVRVAIKRELSPDLTPLDYALWCFLENKTNATSQPNIGLLRIAMEEEWNKMSEEFILKACKSFRRHVETIIKNNGCHI